MKHIFTLFAKRVGDSVLQLENGEFICHFPDTFYEHNITGYWQMYRGRDQLYILRLLRIE
jgi:hypothetical protein